MLPQPAPAIDVLPESAAPPLAAAMEVSSSQEPAFDPQACAELAFEIGEQATAEIRTVFVTETEARLALFRQLSVKTDGKKISREAHSLKSAAGTFGYRRLSCLALQLENKATRLTEGEYRELLDGLDEAYAEGRARDIREAQH